MTSQNTTFPSKACDILSWSFWSVVRVHEINISLKKNCQIWSIWKFAYLFLFIYLPLYHFLGKCDQIRNFMWIWSHLLKKSIDLVTSTEEILNGKLHFLSRPYLSPWKRQENFCFLMCSGWWRENIGRKKVKKATWVSSKPSKSLEFLSLKLLEPATLLEKNSTAR